MYIYTPLCRYWIILYSYVLVFIVPHVDIELEDNKQFISNIPRMTYDILALVQKWYQSWWNTQHLKSNDKINNSLKWYNTFYMSTES